MPCNGFACQAGASESSGRSLSCRGPQVLPVLYVLCVGGHFTIHILQQMTGTEGTREVGSTGESERGEDGRVWVLERERTVWPEEVRGLGWGRGVECVSGGGVGGVGRREGAGLYEKPPSDKSQFWRV